MMRPNFNSFYELPLKLGLIQTLTILCWLRPDFGRNADWLLEQCHRIWLAVGINGSWKHLFLTWLIALKNLREWSTISAEKDLAVLFFKIVLRSCGRKRCLNMWHGNSENSYGCSYLLWICFIYGTNVSVSRSWIPLQVELLTVNKVPFDLPTNECKSKYCPS